MVSSFLNSDVMSPNLRSSGNIFWSNELLKVSTKNGARGKLQNNSEGERGKLQNNAINFWQALLQSTQQWISMRNMP